MSATFPGPADTDLAGNPACIDPAPIPNGGVSDYTTSLDLPTATLNFSNVFTFAPFGTTITPGGAGLPAGTKVGGLHSVDNLGLNNAACNTGITLDFILFSIALPNNANPANATNIVYTQAEGTTDRFHYWVAPVAVYNPATVALPTDTAAHSSNTRADGTDIEITHYPAYLLKLFTPVGDPVGPTTVIPTALYGGMSYIAAASTWVPLYFAQFTHTQASLLNGLAEPYNLIQSAQGEPSVSVLNDPTALQADPSAISDFCTPLHVDTELLGTTPGPHTRATNPAGTGTGFIIQYNASLRDLDQDNIENEFDTCPAVVNVTGSDPRLSGSGDTDNDGIDNNCDTNGLTISDGDGDGFQNRQDNCPQAVNATQVEAEHGVTQLDNGPQVDGIGDTCDTGAVASYTQNGKAQSVTMTTTVANGRYMVVSNVIAKCFGLTDADLDGYCAGANDSNDADAIQHTSWGNFGAGNAATFSDSDGDLFSDSQETYLGTDPTKSCAQSIVPGNANDEAPFDNWAFDFNDDGAVSSSDVLKYSPVFNTIVVPGTTNRFDLNFDGKISSSDVLKFSPVFNKTCSTAGVPAYVQQ